jgi:single-stranded-DNA-specific exonuclease
VYDYRGYSKVVKEQHIKFIIHQHNGDVIDGIGFSMASKIDIVKGGAFDVVYTLDESDYNGINKIQVKVVDVRKSNNG